MAMIEAIVTAMPMFLTKTTDLENQYLLHHTINLMDEL